VFVSRILAPAPSSKKSTDDVHGISTACCMTVPPELTGADHDPVCARVSPPVVVVVVVLVLVVVIELVVVVLVLVVVPVLVVVVAGWVVAVVAGAVCAVVDEPVTGVHAAVNTATAAAIRKIGRRRRGPRRMPGRRPSAARDDMPGPTTERTVGRALCRCPARRVVGTRLLLLARNLTPQVADTEEHES
jgi:hypothetical protein